MPNKNSDEEILPEQLISAWERSANYPRDREGLQFLSQGLVRAAERWDVSMAEIVQRCLDFNPRCPTDADLMTIAGIIHDDKLRAEEKQRNQHAEWERNFGKPEPFVADWDLKQVKAEAERKEREMWTQLRQHFNISAQQWPTISWARIYRAMEQLGYPLNSEQRRLMGE